MRLYKFMQLISFRSIVYRRVHLQWKTGGGRGGLLFLMVPLELEVNWKGFQEPECVND